MKPFKFFMLFSLSLLIIHGASLRADVVVNSSAPDFTLFDSNGQQHSLSDYKGEFVVLEWTNHECPFVKKHYGSGNMQKLQKELTDQGIVWLSIVSSAPGKQGYCTAPEAQELTEIRKAFPTAVLLDPQGEVGKMYKAKTTPHMFIVDPEGMLIYQGAIDSIASADPADILKADNYVRMALIEAMQGNSVKIPSTKSYGCSVKY